VDNLRPDWPTDRLEHLRKLRRSGLSYTKCGLNMGVSRSTISGQVGRHKLDAPLPNKEPSAAARRLAQFDPLMRRVLNGQVV